MQHRLSRVLVHGEVNLRRGDVRRAVKHVVPVAGLVIPRRVHDVASQLERVDVDVERVFVVSGDGPCLDGPDRHIAVRHAVVRSARAVEGNRAPAVRAREVERVRHVRHGVKRLVVHVLQVHGFLGREHGQVPGGGRVARAHRERHERLRGLEKLAPAGTAGTAAGTAARLGGGGEREGPGGGALHDEVEPVPGRDVRGGERARRVVHVDAILRE